MTLSAASLTPPRRAYSLPGLPCWPGLPVPLRMADIPDIPEIPGMGALRTAGGKGAGGRGAGGQGSGGGKGGGGSRGGSGGGGGAFLFDTFTGADGTSVTAHTGEVGATWTQHPSYSTVMVINGNAVADPGAASSGAYASAVPPSADYDVTVVFERGGGGAGTLAIGFGARFDAASNAGYHVRYNPNLSRWELWRFGPASMLGSWDETLSADAQRTVKLELRGTALKLYVAGVERISVSDATFTDAGRVMLLGGGCTTTSLHLNSIQAVSA